MKSYPRVLTIQDLSCLGQCSAAVALPILSACGCEACLLPTMVLSTHTGGLGTPTRRDLSADMEGIVAHWLSQGIAFDGIYVGYLGNVAQVKLVRRVLSDLLAPGGKVIIDPAMADHGRLYSGLTEEYANEMGQLCALADVMLPNMTEACWMTGRAYVADPDDQTVEAILRQLHEFSGREVVLTGVSDQPDRTGAAMFSQEALRFVSTRKLPGNFHGTGDMFAAALAGKWLTGTSLPESAQCAADFVAQAIENTIENPAHGYGVKFETALSMLWK